MKWLVVIIIALSACTSDEPDSHIDQDVRSDAGSRDLGTDQSASDLISTDVGIDTPSDAMMDLGPDMPIDSRLTQFELTTGETFTGELVARYNTLIWWNPLDGPLLAVFNPDGFAPYPNDTSMRFVLESSVVSQQPTTDDGRSSYVEFLRANGIYFHRPPFEPPSFLITAGELYHLEEDGYGNFAWDFEVTDDNGQRYTGLGVQNEDFLVWDETVYSGVTGEVIEVVQNGVDNTPGSHPAIGTAINNLVGIALGGSYYAYYLHFQENGVDPNVVVGSQVDIGDPLGVVGNSGVSLEPHMHVVLLWYDVEAGRSYSIPVEFSTVGVSDEPTGPFERQEWLMPSSSTWLVD